MSFDAFFSLVSRGPSDGAPPAAEPPPPPAPTNAASGPVAHHGQPLSGRAITHTLGGDLSSPQPPCTPITLYSTDFTYQHGNLIAVNENYISYAIKNGKIRVLNQLSAARTLLRGHTGVITDLAFFSNSDNRLASVCANGILFVWLIAEAEDSQEFTHTVLFQSSLAEAAQRVVWHPRSTLLAAACGAQVNLMSCADAPPPAPADVACRGHTGAVNDMCFSPHGRHLATASDDGSLKVWDLQGEGDSIASAVCVQSFLPHGGGPVTRVLFMDTGGARPGDATMTAADAGVLTGGLSNSEVKLWGPVLGQQAPVAAQQLSIRDPTGAAPRFKMLLDQTSQFVMMANVQENSLLVVHLKARDEAPSNERIDYLTPFTLLHPILSCVSINSAIATAAHDTEASAEASGFEVNLFCVQTKAIQQYHMRPSQCYVAAPGDGESAPPPATSSSSGTTPGEAAADGTGIALEPAATSAAARASGQSAAAESESKAPGAVSQEHGEHTTEAKQPAPVAAPSSSLPSSGEPTSSMLEPQAPLPSEEGGPSNANAVALPMSAPARSTGEDAGTAPLRAPATEQAASAASVPDSTASSSTPMQSLVRAHLTDGIEELEAHMTRIMDEHFSRQATEIATLLAPIRAAEGGSTSAASSQSLEAQIQAALKSELQATVVPAMARIVMHSMENNLLKPVKLELQKALTTQLMPKLETKLEKLVTTTVAAQMAPLLPALGQQVATEMHGAMTADKLRAPVTDSFRQCFQEMLIPAFQAATQKMFVQIDNTLQKTLGSIDAASRAHPSMSVMDEHTATLAQVTEQLAQISLALGQLTRQVAALQTSLPTAAAPLPTATAREPIAPNPTEEIQDLVRDGKYEAAFTQVLGKQDLKLLIWLCNQVVPGSLFSMQPPPLSQILLLCLLQQLSSNLNAETALKLAWLKEIALNLDPKSPDIATHVADVLSEVRKSMDQAGPAVRNGSEFKLLTHVVTSLSVR